MSEILPPINVVRRVPADRGSVDAHPVRQADHSLQSSESRRHVGLDHRGEPPPRMMQIEEVLSGARERTVDREIEKGGARPLLGPSAQALLAVRELSPLHGV